MGRQCVKLEESESDPLRLNSAFQEVSVGSNQSGDLLTVSTDNKLEVKEKSSGWGEEALIVGGIGALIILLIVGITIYIFR